MSSGFMIALYVISAIIGLCILIWFIITLNAIRHGIEESNKALWNIAKSIKEKEEVEEKNNTSEEEESGLLNNSEKAKLKTVKSTSDIKVFAVTRREIVNGKDKVYRIDLQIRPDGIEPMKILKAEINADQFKKLELDRKYTKEELEL